MMARFFIERPVLANVIALIMLLLGAVAIFQLPVAQYPPITPVTVQVSTKFPGASAKTLVETVALPIEQQVNGVEGMLYMSSTSSSDGSYNLIVTFDIGTDPDTAQVLVQNRVAAAMAQLPSAVQQQGVVTSKKSTSILQIVTLQSAKDQFDALFLSNYATISIRDELARLPGVGGVVVFGIGEYSMRIWLDPEKMQERSLVPSDVIQAIQGANVNVGAGQLGMPPVPSGQDFQINVNVAGPLDQAEQFESIIVKAASGSGGRITRVRDVARVELGARSYSQSFNLDGRPAGGLAIFLLPDANALDTAAAVGATMRRLAESFPEGLKYDIPLDTTEFVSQSIKEVYVTLLEAGLLVLLVIVLFLQSFRAILVPVTTVPVTIVGAFAAMALMGFTVNTLTLFAIVLAIGIVVDDAIVVVEGSTRHIEKGKSPKEAAIAAMTELTGPILGITLVLMAVFIPAAFMPGVTGQMYRQFALVIAATALISAVNALTLKPTQCAQWLRPVKPDAGKFFLFRGFNWLYQHLENGYVRVVGGLVRHAGIAVLVALVLVIAAGWGLTRVPTGFIPVEDQGYMVISVQLPSGAALGRTQEALSQIAEQVSKVSGVLHAVTIAGTSLLENNAPQSSAGIVYVILKPWDQRGEGEGLLDLYDNLSSAVIGVEAAKSLVLVPPPIQGVGLASGFQMQVNLTDTGFDYAKLEQVAGRIGELGAEHAGIEFAFSPFKADAPSVDVALDRSKAETFAVPVGAAFDTLQSYLGSTYVNQFTRFGHNFMVFAQADQSFRLTPDDLLRFYVRSTSGDMVPIGSLVTMSPGVGPDLISLYNLYPSATVVGIPERGFSTGQAMTAMEQIARDTLAPGMDYAWTGMSYQEQLLGYTQYFIFGLSVLLVYLVLAGQYESWLIPWAVIFAVPLALLGTVSVLLALGVANNLYVQIGLVLLIALSAKNAILIVEVARERFAAGADAAQAAVEAARVRFRPILMTSFAFILGVLPLVLASGAGANARKSIGITVLSGMLASTCLAVLFVPAFYVFLQRLSARGEQPGDARQPGA